MQITRTTNPNGTFRYTLSDGKVITKGSKRRSEWGTIYRLSTGFGTNNTGDITATTHARQDLAAKGSRDLTGAGWVIIAVVEIIDGDAQQAAESEWNEITSTDTSTLPMSAADNADLTAREDGFARMSPRWYEIALSSYYALKDERATEQLTRDMLNEGAKGPTCFKITRYYGDTKIETGRIPMDARGALGARPAARSFLEGEGLRLSDKRREGNGYRWTLTESNGWPGGSVLVEMI